MRVLMITDFYRPLVGGVEVVVRHLARALVARGHHVSVLTIQTGRLPELEDDDGVRVHRTRCLIQGASRMFSQARPWAPPIPDPQAAARIARIVAHEAPDIVHGHDWLARSFLTSRRRTAPRFVQSLHYYTSTCAKKSLMFHGAPCSGPGLGKCLHCAGAHYGRAKGAGVTLGNFAFSALERRVADLFLPVSEATAAGNGLVGSGLPYEVIPNFVAEPEKSSDAACVLAGELPQGDFLLYVGDLRPEKGVNVLLEAYRGLVGAPPLVLIGKLWRDSPAVLPPNVRLFINRENEAVREAQRRCLALVAPSVWPEPFGMVVAETLAAGRPVVATRIGGIPDLVDDGCNGLLVAPGDVPALRAALCRVVDDDALRTRLAKCARISARRLSAAEVVPRFERAYDRAISSRPAPA